MSISWHTLSLISLFIISALTMRIINEMYLFCSLFFVSHSIFLIIISECMSLLILMSILISFFSMFLDISSILISCITTSKLISRRHAFDDISLIQKSFFFSVLLLFFVLTQNISSFNHLFIVSMFLRVDSVSLTSISLVHLTMFFVVIIMILFTSSSSLMKIFTSNFLQWFRTDDDMSTLNTRWLSNDVVDFMLTFFAQLSTCSLFFTNFFSSLLVIFFSLFSWFFMRWLTVDTATRWHVSFSIISVKLLISFQSISSLFLHSLSSLSTCSLCNFFCISFVLTEFFCERAIIASRSFVDVTLMTFLICFWWSEWSVSIMSMMCFVFK